MHHDGALDGEGQSTTSVQIEKSIPADYRWVRRAINELEDWLEDQNVLSEDIGSISIVLAEAMNNIVEHAFDGTDAGQIRLILRQRKAALIFEVRDNGRPMPNGRAPMGNHPMSEFDQFDTMPEGGYGWFLIRELVQDLVYDRQDDENVLFFRYRLNG